MSIWFLSRYLRFFSVLSRERALVKKAPEKRVFGASVVQATRTVSNPFIKVTFRPLTCRYA